MQRGGMRSLSVLFLLCTSFALSALDPHFTTDPALSPDGQTVCFAWQGDLWTVPFAGGIASRLTSTDATESGPIWSRDGQTIYFSSNRNGYNQIWQIPVTGGESRAVSGEPMAPIDVFPDGSLLASGSLGHDRSAFYQVREGERPVEIAGVGDYYASLSPDGSTVVFCRNGDPYREAYRGSAAGELWNVNLSTGAYTQLTHTDFTERYPVDSRIDSFVYYAASDGKVFQLFRAPADDFSHPQQLTHIKRWSVRDLSIAAHSDRLVFEVFDRLWSWDAQTGKAHPIKIRINEDVSREMNVEQQVRDQATIMAAAPNSQYVVFAYGFDLFVVPTFGNGTVRQITHNQPGITDIAILDDSHTVFYSAFDHGTPMLYRFDVRYPDHVKPVSWAKGKYIENLQSTEKHQLIITYSVGEDRRRVAVMKRNGDVIKAVDDNVTNYDFSLCDRTGFYSVSRPGVWNRYLYSTDVRTGKRATLFKDWRGNGQMWCSSDRKALLWNGNGRVMRTDLVALGDYADRHDAWNDILNPHPYRPQPTITLHIDTDGLQQRTRSLSRAPGMDHMFATGPDSLLFFVKENGTRFSVRSISESGRHEEVLFETHSEPHALTYTPGKQRFFWLEDNRIRSFNFMQRPRTVHDAFHYNYNRLDLNRTVFEQAWTEFGRNFYDPKMHGRNWKALRKRYEKFLPYAGDTTTLSVIMDEMIGEVNASHTGFYVRSENRLPARSRAELGMELDYSTSSDRGLRITRVYRNSSLAQLGGIVVGDTLRSINGHTLTAGTDLSPLLLDQVGQPLILGIQHSDSLRFLTVKGLTGREQNDLAYEEWVAERADAVRKLSQGKIGYLHIRSMDSASLNRFREDLFARNADTQAVIIDVRNNGGGRIHDSLIEDLTRKPYGFSSEREYQARHDITPGNVWNKPIIVLVNENSFSDAEIFPILFKELQLGKVVGTPTSGAVIGTTNMTLLDGSTLRLPSSGWWTLDGHKMEGMGAMPDILVIPTPEDIVNDNDVQLQRAVKELLQELAQP